MLNAYQIRVRGQLSPWFVKRLGDFTIAHLPTGDTLLISKPLDQAALYGAICHCRDLSLTLVSINPVAWDEAREQ